MIVPGTATVNPDTHYVELSAPMGFGTARGVRLSNFTGTTITLQNISGVDQSQEYLAPLTQMVYPTSNVGVTPRAFGVGYPSDQIAQNLLVEWSTDPGADFLGTYPAALPTTGVSNNNGTSLVMNQTVAGGIPFLELGNIPSQYMLLTGTVKVAVPGDAVLVSVEEAGEYGSTQAQGAYAAAVLSPVNQWPGMSTYFFSLPVRLAHVGQPILSVETLNGGVIDSAQVNVFATSLQTFNVPLQYIDLPYSLNYQGNVTAPGNVILSCTCHISSNVAPFVLPMSGLRIQCMLEFDTTKTIQGYVSATRGGTVSSQTTDLLLNTVSFQALTGTPNDFKINDEYPDTLPNGADYGQVAFVCTEVTATTTRFAKVTITQDTQYGSYSVST